MAAQYVLCRKCGKPIEGEGFGSAETGFEHPFSCPADKPVGEPVLSDLLREVLDAPYCFDTSCWVKKLHDDHKHTVGHGVVTMAFVAGAAFAVEQIRRALAAQEEAPMPSRDDDTEPASAPPCPSCGGKLQFVAVEADGDSSFTCTRCGDEWFGSTLFAEEPVGH